MNDRIDILDMHIRRDAEVDRRVVQNGADTRRDDHVGDFLRLFGGHRDHGDLDTALFNDTRGLIDGENLKAANAFADFVGRTIEQTRNVKSAFGKTAITRNRTTQIPRADKGDFPLAFDF